MTAKADQLLQKPLPEALRAIAEPLVAKARATLETGEKIKGVAYVGNVATGQLMPVDLRVDSDESTARSMEAVTLAARHLHADFVLSIFESWSLRPDKVDQAEKIFEKYGSIGASPYAVDVCFFGIETRVGTWAATPHIKPKGISKKKRTFGPVVFAFATEAGGNFGKLLPDKTLQ